MTNTETRLRDYLAAEAATVLDTAEGPGLEPPARAHRRWPVVLAAAAVVGILLVAAAVLRNPADQTVPAGPAVPPRSGPPGVPYLVQNASGVTVHDGSRAVAVKNVMFLNGRAAGGWLTALSTPGAGPAGIVGRDGRFRQVGPKAANFPTLSPDKTKIAVTSSAPGAEGRILVVDIRTGKQVATTSRLAASPSLLGWNQDGIWAAAEGPQPGVLVWKPGAGEPRRVAIPGSTGGAAVQPNTRTVLVTTAGGGSQCIKAGLLEGDHFKVVRESCHQGPGHPYPVLSTDGRVLVNSLTKEAVDIPSGRATKLDVPDRMLDWPEPVFEDATNLLVIRQRDLDHGRIGQTLYRCNVVGGKCVQLKVKDVDDLTLQRP